MTIGYRVKGLGKTPWLDELLETDTRHVPFFGSTSGLSHIAGWGLKPSGKRARRFARVRGLPYVPLEDGFIRSLGLGVEGSPLHSMVVDYSGIYYDATRPSDLETQIVRHELTHEESQRARAGIELLRRYRLSKYNHAPDVLPASLENSQSGVRRVLVIDQTARDASIRYGLASADSFADMLEAAVTDHPESEVLVKVHPDVLAGKKKGHLLQLARQKGCTLVSENVNPWALLDHVEQVYVVTSQMGFEALLAGKTVHCFGMPFYAGWGLTHDRVHCERRGVPRSLEAVFHAAYLKYCRYINPYTGQRCEFEDTVALIAEQKKKGGQDE
ncbi:MAG: hypothetical protein HLX50_01725 [Alteromonadaceae bacterium]|nr:hypothetical protein [Alteromonadaceae bacterium]